MKYLYLLFFSICATSCECESSHRAYVFDRETQYPIENAKVTVTTYTHKGKEESQEDIYTDEKGYYKASTGLRGSSGSKCPHLKMYITKDGYIPYTVTEYQIKKIDTIYMDKQ